MSNGQALAITALDPLAQRQQIDNKLHKCFVLRGFQARVFGHLQATPLYPGESVEIPLSEALEAQPLGRVRTWMPGDPEPLTESARALREIARKEQAIETAKRLMNQPDRDRQADIIQAAVQAAVTAATETLVDQFEKMMVRVMQRIEPKPAPKTKE